MPRIDVSPGSSLMAYSEYTGNADQIRGTSFAAPLLLSAAIQAHQYEGWFSALVHPMVNKAVLLASTRDANGDGPIGRGTRWSQNGGAPASAQDAKDGAGQIDFGALKSILDENRYAFRQLTDASFTSCGTACREHVVTTMTIPAYTRIRASLAWQACVDTNLGASEVNNDLDLVLACSGSPPLDPCGGTLMSNSVQSEIEMLERPGCFAARTCTLSIRIKNGATLEACPSDGGAVAVERAGVAWHLAAQGGIGQ